MSVVEAIDEKPGFTVDVMPIQGKSVSTLIGMMDQADLRFFPENPRVYSIVREEGKHPSQEGIEAKLQEMEHVKALVHDIKKHGGLIDPLVVKQATLEVVEGNSRLAAYRLLARQSLKWAQVKVRVLPASIDDKAIAALLAQWHLRGKKEWPPYEQAGYLYRRHHDQQVSFSALAAEVGSVSAARVDKIIEAFALMVEQGDTKRERWSYYDELVKSRKIAKVCDAHPSLKQRVLTMIRQGEFARAQDLRDDLPVICDGPPKNLVRFANGKVDFDDALEIAKEAGGDSSPYQKIRKFRTWLAEQETLDALISMEGQVKDRMEFEVKKLQNLLGSILKTNK